MIYCMSDIHGEYDRFLTMLEKINFSECDVLYVLGDVVDRKPNGIDILLDIMSRPNVHMILGNHEAMLYSTLGPLGTPGARQLWQQNGGAPTRRDLLYHRTAEERNKVLRFIEKLPDHLDIEVGERRFHLVHGSASDNREDRIWERPDPKAPAPMPGVTVIVGHTPTPLITGNYEDPVCIWHGDGIIDIDCGCGNKSELRRLACLRLDDMTEFYV